MSIDRNVARRKTKIIVVTGGVLSGLGKGIAVAAIGSLLSSKLKVVPIKCDGYLNSDPGTMNPIEHGEVYVLDDGGEVDMDFGHYERFMNIACRKEWSITMGKVFGRILEDERKGLYLGKTVQMIPHVTDLIKRQLHDIAEAADADVLIVEIGGTVGDMENELYLEAMRQLKADVGKDNICYVHLSYVPVPENVSEQKTKPTQQSVKLLNERGIFPDIIIARCSEMLTERTKEKIALFCNIDREAVITGLDVEQVYEVPMIFDQEGIVAILHRRLGIYSPPELTRWSAAVRNLKKPQNARRVDIAVAGKYSALGDSYASVREALVHCSAYTDARVEVELVDTTPFDDPDADLSVLDRFDGVIVPGGFGTRGIEGKIRVIRYCRENKVPLLGICYGMQLAVIEFARNVCGLAGAHTTEVSDDDKSRVVEHPVVCYLPGQDKVQRKGGTMRLGGHDVLLKAGSRVAELYGSTRIRERFRHRYEINPEYVERLGAAGLVFSGTNRDGSIMQAMELPGHPFFVAGQFHPELTSRLTAPAPLFQGLVRAAEAAAQRRPAAKPAPGLRVAETGDEHDDDGRRRAPFAMGRGVVSAAGVGEV